METSQAIKRDERHPREEHQPEQDKTDGTRPITTDGTHPCRKCPGGNQPEREKTDKHSFSKDQSEENGRTMRKTSPS